MKVSFWELKALGTKKYDSESVKSLRNKFNLSKSEFAEILNVTPRQVYRWEKGQSIPTGSSLSLLHMIDIIDMEQTDRLNHFRSKGKIDKPRNPKLIDKFYEKNNDTMKFSNYATKHELPDEAWNYYDQNNSIDDSPINESEPWKK